MLSRSRHTLALTLALLAHVAAFAWSELSLLGNVEIPELEFELTHVELLDPDVLQGDHPTAIDASVVVGPPQPEVPPKDAEASEEDGKKEQDKAKPEKRRIAKRKSKADQLGPPSSTFYALLVPRRIRKLPFAEQAMDIMAPLPDFEFLIRDGGFDALRDFDHMVIASPDIRDATQTFLAVDYAIPRAQVKQALEKAAASRDETIDWIESDGILRGNPKPRAAGFADIDPRFFVLPADNVALYVRKEFLPHILNGEASDRKTAGNYVANLAKLKRFANRQPRTGLQLVVKDLRAALKRAKGLPFEVPDAIEISAEAAKNPEVLLRLTFLSRADAKAAKRFWHEDLRKIIDGTLSLKLSVKWIYELMELEQKGSEIRLWGRLTTSQAEMVLKLLSDLSARVLHKSPEELSRARARQLQNAKDRQTVRQDPAGERDAGSLRKTTEVATPATQPHVQSNSPTEDPESSDPTR